MYVLSFKIYQEIYIPFHPKTTHLLIIFHQKPYKMMDNPKLFHSMADKNLNILPMDGEVFYYGIILNELDANNWFDILSEEIEWRHDEAVMFGKKIITNRKVAWYADQPFTYTYSNVTNQPYLGQIAF